MQEGQFYLEIQRTQGETQSRHKLTPREESINWLLFLHV